MKLPVLTGVVIIEGHVQGLANARALGRAGIPVLVVSTHDCLARYSRYTGRFFKCPPYLSEEFIVFLTSLARKERLMNWVLLPSNDHAVFNISMNSDRLGEYYKVISPPPDILGKIYNKELLIRLCLGLGIAVPASWFPGAGSKITGTGLKYPLLVKGKQGLSFYRKTGRKAFPARNEEELETVLAKLEGAVGTDELYLQELLPSGKNKTVSFTAFSIGGKIMATWSGIKVREHPLTFGTSTYSRSTHVEGLRASAERLLGKLGYTGPCEIEFLFDPEAGVYKLIEMNARTWLWVGMAVKDGVNYPLMVYNYLNGIETVYPEEKEYNSSWIHYIVDIPYGIAGLLKGQYTLKELLTSYIEFPAPAVLDTRDPLPSLAELFLLPQFIFKR